MTFIFVLSGAIGSRLLPSSISAPAPLAHQWLPLMPLPMNSTPNRLGNSPAMAPAEEVAPHAESDSKYGNAIVTPTPCKNVRREGWDCWCLSRNSTSIAHD